MRSQDFARIEALFDEVVILDATARPAALDASCADRPDSRREVEALLAAHDRIGGCGPDDMELARHVVRPSTQLGVFRLVERIGEGGMGDVFRAARADGAFTQQVAIKVMRSSLADPDLQRRFKAGRQILATLQHPNVVALLDGGATPLAAGES